MKRFEVTFGEDLPIPGVCVTGPDDLSPALAGLGLRVPRPVLILLGGAANLDPAIEGPLLRLFESLAPRIQRAGAVVIDGATDYGVMRLMGRARRRAGARFPLVGVAALGTVHVPALERSEPNGKAALDPNHSHFILVPGAQWGDESPWIQALGTTLADGCPTLALVAAGGKVTRIDVTQAVEARRPMLVIAGSGGTADELARWRRGEATPWAMTLGDADVALVQVLDLGEPDAIADWVSESLGT